MNDLTLNVEQSKQNSKKQASIALWDSMANSFMNKKLPTFEEDSFLRLIQERGMLKNDFSILDVGCGTGTYSVVLAQHCKKVVGIDLSSKMIELAKQTAKKSGSKNVEFYCIDWHDLDLEKVGFEQKFDLVIAHNTPAIQCDATFMNLSKASNGWCVLSKPTHRVDPVSDKIKRLAKLEEKRENSDKVMADYFQLLWKKGILPYFHYEKQCWNLKKTKEEAYGLYINRVKTFRDLSVSEENLLKEHINQLEKDGYVEESVKTTITTLYWNVKGEIQ